MCALSHRIREEPNWWEKVKDEVILEKWREEALKRDETSRLEAWTSSKLTPAMVELQHPRTALSVFTLISRSTTY